MANVQVTGALAGPLKTVEQVPIPAPRVRIPRLPPKMIMLLTSGLKTCSERGPTASANRSNQWCVNQWCSSGPCPRRASAGSPCRSSAGPGGGCGSCQPWFMFNGGQQSPVVSGLFVVWESTLGERVLVEPIAVRARSCAGRRPRLDPVVYRARVDRMSRVQFFGATAGLDQERLRQVLWTLYWRGPAPVRLRIEAELAAVRSGDSSSAAAASSRSGPAESVDPAEVLARVSEFVSLVRSGAYFAGDRRVSPKQRTRWRFVFKELVGQARKALAAEQGTDGAAEVSDSGSGDGSALGAGPAAMELLVDLACTLRDMDYVRSQDPVAAAGVVVSDEVAVLWGHLLERDGVDRFARTAMAQLLRWESPYGWTRRGDGAVAQRETTLAQVLAGLLTVPDAWEAVAEQYLATLDGIIGPARGARERATVLADWHELLLDRLTYGTAEALLDRVAGHRALATPERDSFAARLAHRRDVDV
jgi:hypothetical protein